MSALEPIQLERLREIGALLRREREAKGLSLEDVSAKTLIRPTILKAIEEADAKPLPEPVYLRGFIRRYGDLVDLPGVELSDSFPWEPSKVVPAAFVASGVTTAESVEETRRPVSLPRSEARVVEPDPVPLNETETDDAAPPVDLVSADAVSPEQAPVEQASVEQASVEQASVGIEGSTEFVNPYAAMPQDSLDELTAEPAVPSESSPMPAVELTAPEQAEMAQTTDSVVEDEQAVASPNSAAQALSKESIASPLNPPGTHQEEREDAGTNETSAPASNLTVESPQPSTAPIPEDPWQSEPTPIISSPDSSPTAASGATGYNTTKYATESLKDPSGESSVDSSTDSFTPLPIPQPPSPQKQSNAPSSGLPGAMIALILAAAALGIGVAFALSNRGSEPVTQQTPEAAPTAESVTPEPQDPPAPADSEPPAAPEPTAQPNNPPAVATPEVASQEAEVETPTAKTGEVSVALKLKEPAWFFVEVDGFVVFEGTTGEYSQTVKGKEVVIGTSRPDLLLVSVDGNTAKPMGSEPGDKTETYKPGG